MAINLKTKAMQMQNWLREVFDLKGIDWRLWLLLFLSFFLPFAMGFSQLPALVNSAIFYAAIPLAIILIVFRASIKNFGISFGIKKKVIIYSIVFSLLLAPAIAIAYALPDVRAYYSIKTIADLGDFIYFEAMHGALLFFWEFFFRGFILFGLFSRIGKTALPVHAIPFALFHMGKPSAEVIASFFAALLLGQIALKANTFLPAFFIHWAIHAEMIFLANFA